MSPTRRSAPQTAQAICAFLLLGVLYPDVARAAHPLITEDTGTQGTGRFQLELTTEHGYRDEDPAAEHERQFAGTFSWGVRDNLDVIFTLPYQRVSPQAGGGIATHSGISDAGVDAKWRFLEKDRLSMALKPGITFPTGDEAAGLGSGKSAYSLFLVTTIEPEPWALHLHLGYLRHRNAVDEREGIWHASLGGWREFGKKLRIVGDIGANANTDKTSDNETAFLLLGVIYSLNPDFDLDAGIKRGLTNAETDYTLLAGITFRF